MNGGVGKNRTVCTLTPERKFYIKNRHLSVGSPDLYVDNVLLLRSKIGSGQIKKEKYKKKRRSEEIREKAKT